MRFKSIFHHYWKFLRRYPRSQIGLFSAFGVGKLIDEAAVPIIFKLIIDTVSEPPADPAAKLTMLLWALAGAYVVMNIVFRIGDYLVIKSQSKILEDLTNYALERLHNHSYTFFTNAFTGGLIAKARRFVNAFETLHDQVIFSIWFGLISLLTSLSVLAYFSPPLALAFFLWLVTYAVIVRYLVKFQIPKSMENAAADTTVTAHFSDIIANFFTVMMFGTRAREAKEFMKTAAYQREKRDRAWMQEGFWNSMWQGININAFTVIFLAIAVWLWLEGTITAGTIVLMQIYALSSFSVVWNISKNFIRISTALTDADEMVAIFDADIGVKDPVQPERVKITDGDIRFRGVTFRYEENAEVFKNLNLHIKAGEKVALVGHSGAGKTTITKLLLRFNDITDGTITIDGQDITKVRQDDLRTKIAYVPQEPLLFHRTLKENIAYAKPGVTKQEIREVAKKAHAHEFIGALPHDYDTLVGERGVKLSGGERQRVAVARAMLKDAPIIMLDEATSALDSVSEKMIQEGFEELMKGKTTIVIAHRLSTIQKMDRIIVFDKGEIAEDGTHDELIRAGGVYQELWEHQAGGFIQD